jgi:hypothetical protein|tara:strand:- start:506 stop:631 length:126 start_codon:yes stop_codon:yes gene_type:complete
MCFLTLSRKKMERMRAEKIDAVSYEEYLNIGSLPSVVTSRV